MRLQRSGAVGTKQPQVALFRLGYVPKRPEQHFWMALEKFGRFHLRVRTNSNQDVIEVLLQQGLDQDSVRSAFGNHQDTAGTRSFHCRQIHERRHPKQCPRSAPTASHLKSRLNLQRCTASISLAAVWHWRGLQTARSRAGGREIATTCNSAITATSLGHRLPTSRRWFSFCCQN